MKVLTQKDRVMVVVTGTLCCGVGLAGGTEGFEMALGNGNTRSEIKFWGKGIVTS